jgi:hypothetical protein
LGLGLGSRLGFGSRLVLVLVRTNPHLKEAPPQIAISQRPARSACTARATATSDEEQAVCTTSAGPVRPRW